jgi:hypothetical protein
LQQFPLDDGIGWSHRFYHKCHGDVAETKQNNWQLSILIP